MPKLRKTVDFKCKKCGYEVTPLKKWLHMGPPLCPKHTTEMEPIGNWEEI